MKPCPRRSDDDVVDRDVPDQAWRCASSPGPAVALTLLQSPHPQDDAGPPDHPVHRVQATRGRDAGAEPPTAAQVVQRDAAAPVRPSALRVARFRRAMPEDDKRHQRAEHEAQRDHHVHGKLLGEDPSAIEPAMISTNARPRRAAAVVLLAPNRERLPQLTALLPWTPPRGRLARPCRPSRQQDLRVSAIISSRFVSELTQRLQPSEKSPSRIRAFSLNPSECAARGWRVVGACPVRGRPAGRPALPRAERLGELLRADDSSGLTQRSTGRRRTRPQVLVTVTMSQPRRKGWSARRGPLRRSSIPRIEVGLGDQAVGARRGHTERLRS